MLPPNGWEWLVVALAFLATHVLALPPLISAGRISTITSYRRLPRLLLPYLIVALAVAGFASFAWLLLRIVEPPFDRLALGLWLVFGLALTPALLARLIIIERTLILEPAPSLMLLSRLSQALTGMRRPLFVFAIFSTAAFGLMIVLLGVIGELFSSLFGSGWTLLAMLIPLGIVGVAFNAMATTVYRSVWPDRD